MRQPAVRGGRPLRGFRDKVAVSAYPTATLGGLVWAYLGPAPAPLLPDFEPFGWEHGFVEIIMTELPCNWFQCHENGMDPVHFEWLHLNGNAVRTDPADPEYVPTHLSIDFLEFEYGFVNGRVVEVPAVPRRGATPVATTSTTGASSVSGRTRSRPGTRWSSGSRWTRGAP